MKDSSLYPKTNQRVFAVSLAIFLNIFFLKLFDLSEMRTRIPDMPPHGVSSITILRFDDLSVDRRKFDENIPRLKQKLVKLVSRHSLKKTLEVAENLAPNLVTESHVPAMDLHNESVKEGGGKEVANSDKLSIYFDDPRTKNVNIRRAINETVASLRENEKKKKLKPPIGKWSEFNKDVDFASIPECSDKDNALKYNPPIIAGVKLAGIFALPSLAHAAFTGKCK